MTQLLALGHTTPVADIRGRTETFTDRAHPLLAWLIGGSSQTVTYRWDCGGGEEIHWALLPRLLDPWAENEALNYEILGWLNEYVRED